MAGCGFDCGTFHLMTARRDEKGEVKTRKEVNAFIEIPLDNRYTFNMFKKAKVPLIEREDENVAYAVSDAAVNIAYTLNQPLKRPMSDGCLNPKEHNAFRILNIMISTMIGEPSVDKEVLYYSVPANSVNEDTDIDYHQKVLDQIFKGFKSKSGKTVQPYPINEALAIIFAELAEKNYTGVAISFGGGMINVCYAIMSQPVFTFSIVNSGDWIDQQAAKACGETPVVINREKMKIDLLKPPTTLVERAIQSQYQIMIEKTVTLIKESLLQDEMRVRTDIPLDIVIAGGTSSPNGFLELFKQTVDMVKLPMVVGEIRKSKDHLGAVARGCLVAAENA